MDIVRYTAWLHGVAWQNQTTSKRMEWWSGCGPEERLKILAIPYQMLSRSSWATCWWLRKFKIQLQLAKSFTVTV